MGAEASYVSDTPDKLDFEPRREGGEETSPLRLHFISHLIDGNHLEFQPTHMYNMRTPMSLWSSGNDNNSYILKFSALQESEDKGRTRTARSPRGREAKQVGSTSPFASAIEKPHKKGPPVPTTLQHSTRRYFCLPPTCSKRSKVIAHTYTGGSLVSLAHFPRQPKNGFVQTKGRKKVGDTMMIQHSESSHGLIPSPVAPPPHTEDRPLSFCLVSP